MFCNDCIVLDREQVSSFTTLTIVFIILYMCACILVHTLLNYSDIKGPADQHEPQQPSCEGSFSLLLSPRDCSWVGLVVSL